VLNYFQGLSKRTEVVFMKQKILKNVSFVMGFARSVNFTSQGLLLPLIDRVFGEKRERENSKFGESIRGALPKVKALLKIDSENIANGYYPISVLFQESPLDHYFRLPFLIGDAIRASYQRKSKETSRFKNDDFDFVANSPEYYQRNFHFQEGGYLNDSSAKLYDHQVEILFSGTAQVMRRQMIPHLKMHFNHSNGEGLKFLEIGSGTGALTRLMSLAFPKAQITCVDLSPHYLKYAQNRLVDFKRINFIQGQGENLDFKDETYDAVFSCYLFHELPQNIRKEVIDEKWRVLKKGGFLGIMDSIQKGDDVDLDWALKEFPIDFHEPFYKNYVENNLEPLVKRNDSKVQTDIYFLSKMIHAKK
jgi:ubiquinone/menaquinone biosynthesis C-methylase UbiE